MSQTVKFKIELESNGAQVLQTLSVDADDLRKVIIGAAAEVKNFGGTLGGLAEKGLIFTTLKEAVDSLLNTFSGLAGQYDNFDRSMRAVNTMAGENREGLALLKDEVEDLSGTIPLVKEELANGLYQVISNAVPKDNWIQFLEQSARAAVGGIADLGQTVTVTATIIKNYGYAWEAAEEIQNKIQVTAKNGVTSFEQLAAHLPRVTGQAASLDVQINELLASFATLTGVSGNTAEVSTQLAGVFSALTRPTGEAIKLAEKMGIKFDAAAIQAAGGLRNFLTQLTQDVKRYSDETGMLEQEIFGRLFGSSEALRALIPLTGELAEKFDQNIGAMENSTGVIDAAFKDMANGGRESALVWKNTISSVFDWAGAIASAIHPYLSFVAAGGQAIYGLTVVASALKKARLAALAYYAAQKKNVVISTIVALHHKIQSLALSLLSANTRAAATSTWALTAATAALYAALTMGISIAISGLVSLISSMGRESEETSEKLAKADEDIAARKRELLDISNATSTIAQREIATLKQLYDIAADETKSKRERAAAVKELQQQYPDYFSKISSEKIKVQDLTQSYNALYDSIIKSARAKAAQQKIEENMGRKIDLEFSLERENEKLTQYEQGEREAMLNHATAQKKYNRAKEEYDNNYVGKYLLAGEPIAAQPTSTSDLNAESNKLHEANKLLTQARDSLSAQKSVVSQITAEIGEVDEANKKLAKMIDKPTTQPRGSQNTSGESEQAIALIEGAKSYKELANNIAFYEKAMESADASDRSGIISIAKKIASLKEAQAAFKDMVAEANRPVNLDTLANIDKEIEYQKGLREKATSEHLSGIDAEIRRLNALRTAFEENSHSFVALDKIKTYEQLSAEIDFYENKLKHATSVERGEIQSQINKLHELQEEWDESLARLNMPEDISLLNTIDKLDRAISYYEERIKHASAEEIAGFQRSKSLLEEKRNSMMRLSEISIMEHEVTDLGGISDRHQLKLELDLIGLEGVRSKITSLQRMLADTRSPLNDDQRERVSNLLNEWRNYEKQMRRNDLQIRDVWGTVRGLGGSLTVMTQAVKGNGSAWDKMVGIVDGLVGVYDSVRGIVGIVQLFTKATRASTVAKTAEAAATTTGTVAQGAGAIMAETAAAAQIPVIMGNKAATSSYLELAAAAYFAAHAFIPFVGFGIAAGFVAAAVSTTKTIGATAFAKGGVVYGPTLGLVGEYAGASNNPEIIAPLDRLKSLIQPTGGFSGGKVEFKIDGRVLRGVLERVDNIRNRTK